MRQEISMTKPLMAAMCCIAVLSLSSSTDILAADQDAPEEKIFNLVVGKDVVDDDEAPETEVTPPYRPAIQPGTLDLTLTLGYFNMEKALLRYNDMIYLATPENYFYGDIELQNKTGFNPILRLGYTLTSWFALEAQTGVTFAEYQGTITSPRKIDPRIGIQVPEAAVLGQYDAERRSTFIWINNLNALWYPLNMDGDGGGRLHPYLTGGLGMAFYEIDSEYTNSNASGMNFNAGLGINLIADKRINIRAELVYHRHQIQFEPAENFDERDEGTVQIPVYEFDEVGQVVRVAQFPKQTLSGMTMQIGFSAKF
jgi:hypothetical protein